MTYDQRGCGASDKDFRDLSIEALVVVGGRDSVVAPDIERAAARLLRSAEQLELTDCGHAAFIEDPSTHHEALLKFLRDRTGART